MQPPPNDETNFSCSRRRPKASLGGDRLAASPLRDYGLTGGTLRSRTAEMALKMIFTGDVNLMNVTDPTGPFSLVAEEFRAADIVFSNLECCLYQPPSEHSVEHEGFYADPSVAGEALKSAGIHAVGVANNVNYGEAAITGSIARLDEIGIAHTGAGANRAAARAPVVLDRDGVRFGFLQRSSVYWPTN